MAFKFLKFDIVVPMVAKVPHIVGQIKSESSITIEDSTSPSKPFDIRKLISAVALASCVMTVDPQNILSTPLLSLLMAVLIPALEAEKVDVFINDLIDTFPDSPENLARKPHAVPLAMHVTSRPHAEDKKSILRRAILSMLKLLAEGSPAEQHIVLGWLLDTRRLLVSLPDDKYAAPGRRR